MMTPNSRPGETEVGEGDDLASKVSPFRFDITDGGAGNFLLVYYSIDRVYCADSWHETLEEAYAAAQECYGVARSEWQPPVLNSRASAKLRLAVRRRTSRPAGRRGTCTSRW